MTTPPPSESSALVASSRRSALDRVRTAVEQGQPGPVLITGEPGAGKTWLAGMLEGELLALWRLVKVDLAVAMDAVDFLRLITEPLGVAVPDRLGAARMQLRGVLQDEATDGRRWLLVIDEAHRGSESVWDEVKAIVNQLGQPGGFAALIVVGETELVRTLSARSFHAIASALKAHVHLMPLDLDEARDLLGLHGGGGEAVERALEEVHRDGRGNPRMLLRLAQERAELRSASMAHASQMDERGFNVTSRGLPSYGLSVLNDPPEEKEPDSALENTTQSPEFLQAEAPPLIPSRPPLRVEDGLIEVGWEGDLESEFDPPARAGTSREHSLADGSSFADEPVEDRYAALQAWHEWTRNQSQSDDSRTAQETGPTTAAPGDQVEEDKVLEAEPGGAVNPPDAVTASGIRAESEHEFAPYSRLFTRMRQSKHPGP
jgi:general secretion pathway protein A